MSEIPCRTTQEIIDELKRERDAAVAMLRRLEWHDVARCPECNGSEPRHSPDCELDAILIKYPALGAGEGDEKGARS